VNVNVTAQSSTGATDVRGDFRDLYLDGLLHGVSDLSDPTVLYYPYENLYAQTIAQVRKPGSDVDAFFIGGGSYTFPRYLEAKYGGRIDVAEIDPAVTKVARSRLGLSPSSRMDIHDEDARRFLRNLPADRQFDFVFGDAFNDFEVPYHLTTREFDQLVAKHLKPDGLYHMNVIDTIHFDFLRSEVKTLQQVFPYVGVIAVPGNWPPSAQGKNRVTYVILAGKRIPKKGLPAVTQAQLDAFMSSGKAVTLTDDQAPVEQLLAPTFAQALQGRG